MRKKNKILTVVGARPHFIKVAALIKSINPDRWDHILVHSGQHYDDSLSARFFTEFDLPEAHYNLEIGSQLPNLQISDCIRKLDRILEQENPDMVLVIGDTNTTAAASIAVKKRNILLGHIEAGLREFDRSVPEEINKLITDALADLFFVPTQTGVENLTREGKLDQVYLTGDIGLDHLVDQSAYPNQRELVARFSLLDKYVFMTCHRQANTSSRVNLESILTAASSLACQVVFSIHPRTNKALSDFNLFGKLGSNIMIIPPLGFWDTQALIRGAQVVLTDSGGIIKESYFHGVPVIIIDEQTEWKEILDEGWAVLAGTDRNKIIEAYNTCKVPEEHKMSLGNGNTGAQIVQIIDQFLDVKKS